MFCGGVSCAELFTSVWQSTQVKMLPWMESLNAWESTCRLTTLPFTSCDREAWLWQARHSSAVGLGGSFLGAAWSATAAKKRARAPPGSKKFRIVRGDLLSPAIS